MDGAGLFLAQDNKNDNFVCVTDFGLVDKLIRQDKFPNPRCGMIFNHLTPGLTVVDLDCSNKHRCCSWTLSFNPSKCTVYVYIDSKNSVPFREMPVSTQKVGKLFN